MAEERLTGIDHAPRLAVAEHALGNEVTLRALIAGGNDRDVIVQQIVTEMADDPVGQVYFLRMLFRNMAREGNAEVTDRRDAALEILKSGALNPIVGTHQFVVLDAYLEAIRQQGRENDAISGSIKTLLEAGKAIAPYLPQDTQTQKQIVDAWKQVAQQFRTKEEQSHILSKVGELKARMSPKWRLDAQVEQLRKQGLSNSQIAEQLGKKRTNIEASVHRLIAAGRIEPAPKGRPTEAVAQLDRDVEQLRKQGLSNSQIAEQLGKKRTNIEASVHRLIAAGRIEPAHREGIRSVLEQILERHLAENPQEVVTLVELAKEVGVSRERVRQLYPQIAATQEVPPLKSRQLKGAQEGLDQRVEKLRRQGLDRKAIAEKLQVTSKLVSQALSRIHKNQIRQREDRVRELRAQGYGDKKISEITGIHRYAVHAILRQFARKGEAMRLRKKRQTREEMERFDKQLIALRADPRNLTLKQIAEITGDIRSTAQTRISKLTKAGKIPKKL